MSVEAQLHAGTHVFMTSPSANRVYRSLSEAAVQEVRLSVGPDARLEWLPEVTIPFAGSRVRQSIQVDLAPGATVVLCGRHRIRPGLRRRRWAFAIFENEIYIRTSQGGSVVEQYGLAPGQLPESVGLVGRWDYARRSLSSAMQSRPMSGNVLTQRLLRFWSSVLKLCWEGFRPRQLQAWRSNSWQGRRRT